MKRIGLWLLVILMLLFMANVAMMWRVESQIASKVAAIRAAGEPASVAELRPAPIPSDFNAAAQIELLQPHLKGWGHDHLVFFESDLGKAYAEREDKNAGATDEQADAMRAILAKYPQLAEGLSRAAACERWASRGDFGADPTRFLNELMDRVSQFRDAMRFAYWQVLVSAHDGKTDDALRQGIEILRLGRLHEAEPTISSGLVSIAVEHMAVNVLEVALASGEAAPEMYAELDTELARTDDPQSLARVLTTERAYTLDAVDQMVVGKSPLVAKFFMWKVRSYFLDGLEFYDAMLPAVSRPWSDVHNIYSFLPGGAVNPAQQLYLPGMQASYEAFNRRTALVRSLRVLNALAEYAQKNGREASGLADLNLPAAATIDPFSGKPLLLKRTSAGWIVYSVGKDEKDDGGELSKSDVGVGAAGKSGEATSEAEN